MADFDMTRARRVLSEYEAEADEIGHVLTFLYDQVDSYEQRLTRVEQTVNEYRHIIQQHTEVPA